MQDNMLKKRNDIKEVKTFYDFSNYFLNSKIIF